MSTNVVIDWKMVAVIVIACLLIYGVVSTDQLGVLIEKAKGLFK